jgi:hypothetical protein
MKIDFFHRLARISDVANFQSQTSMPAKGKTVSVNEQILVEAARIYDARGEEHVEGKVRFRERHELCYYTFFGSHILPCWGTGRTSSRTLSFFQKLMHLQRLEITKESISCRMKCQAFCFVICGFESASAKRKHECAFCSIYPRTYWRGLSTCAPRVTGIVLSLVHQYM